MRAADLRLDTLFQAPPSPTGSERLEDVERAHLLAVLAAAGGNKAEAARRLDIGAATLFRKLKRYREEGTWDG